METKNICGKIPVELHEKVREELEGTEMTIPQFLQKVIEEHFMKKGVEKMEAKTLAVQVSEELFNRLKERVEKEKRQRRGRFTQKDRKSTRLNSSHQIISYAVFCLKKGGRRAGEDCGGGKG